MPENAPILVTDLLGGAMRRAVEEGAGWELRRVEVRTAGGARFPELSAETLRELEELRAAGFDLVACSPGLLEGPVEDEARLAPELERTLPRAVEMAHRLGCRRIVTGAFACYPGEPERNRLFVLRALERVAETADAAGLEVAAANAPESWFARPQEAASLLAELGHPTLRTSWDPAALLRVDGRVTPEAVDVLHPFLSDVRITTFGPVPAGEGAASREVPWPDVLHWVAEAGVSADLTLDPAGDDEADGLRMIDDVRALLDATSS